MNMTTKNHNSIRSFLAVDCAQAFSDDIAYIHKELHRHRSIKAQVTWVDPKICHCTLHFFGDLSARDIEDVKTFMRDFSSHHDAFRVGLGSLGAFPSFEHPRVIWVGLTEEEEAFAELKISLDSVLRKNGFSVEDKQFVPHVTIARVKEFNHDHEFAQHAKSIHYTSEKKLSLSEIILFKSVLTSQGPLYTPLEKFKFRTIT
jgi:RNA 2',3'-cyclic 3'-phosphodiesterase